MHEVVKAVPAPRLGLAAWGTFGARAGRAKRSSFFFSFLLFIQTGFKRKQCQEEL